MPTKEKTKPAKKPRRSAFRQSLIARDKAKPPPPVVEAPFGLTTRGKPKVKNGPGRPPTIPQPDYDNPTGPAHLAFLKTTSMLAGLGQIWATTKECAAVLQVSEQAFISYIQRFGDAREAYERGKQNGKVSLRRIQLDLAKKFPAMAIFLGKQQLGQRDQRYEDVTVRTYDLSRLTDKELDMLEELSKKIEAAGEIEGEEPGVSYLLPPTKTKH